MKTQSKVKLAFLASTLSMLAGCQTITSMSKEQFGTAVGAVAGAVLGKEFCGEDNRSRRNKCVVVASGLGGLLGNKLGSYLDEQDKQRMALATRNAAASGRSVSWSDPQKGTSGTARVLNTRRKDETVKVPVLKQKIATVPPLEIIGEPYKTKSISNLRGGPGTDYVEVGQLASGKVVNVVGKVKTKNWYLISHNDGIGSGFIYAPLLKPAENAQIASSDVPVNSGDVAQVQVAANRTCRTINQSIKLADGSTKSETIEACQGTNGWETSA